MNFLFQLKSAMILEFSLVSSKSKFVRFNFTSTFDPLNQTHNPETTCVGGGGIEIDVDFQINHDLSTSSMIVYEGVLRGQDDRDRFVYVTICTEILSIPLQTIEISTSSIQYISTVASSIDFGPDFVDQTAVTLEAINRFDEALTKRNRLFDDHVQAWSKLWQSGIDIEPADDQPFVMPRQIFDTDRDGHNDTLITTFSRSLDLAQHIKSSTYFLLSSSREDWP